MGDSRSKLSAARIRIVGGVAIILLWAVWYMWPGPEVYMTCQEVTGYFGEKLELNHGQFRYWMYSDVVLFGQPKYPLTGTYTLEGNRLTLNIEDLLSTSRVRIMDCINGVPVVWRNDGWTLWIEKKEIHPYGVMIRTPRALLPFLKSDHPSLTKISRP